MAKLAPLQPTSSTPAQPPVRSAAEAAAGPTLPMPVRWLPIDMIRPGSTQARQRFAVEALAELARSIEAIGIVQPLVVRGGPQRFELLAGERRWRAAQIAGLHELPVVVRNDLTDGDAESLGLIENLQRESLSPIETAMGLQSLGQRLALTHEAIGTRIGKSRVYVTHFLRLLSLPAEVQQWVDEGRLSIGHAKLLLALPAPRQLAWARDVLQRGWSVRALERQLATLDRPASAAKPAETAAGHELRRLETTIAEQLGYPVRIEALDGGRGELRIRFHSPAELEGVLERIGVKPEQAS